MAYDILRAVAIDPGKTTGTCVGFKDGKRLYLAPAEHRFQHRDLWEWLVQWNPYQVICEDFEYRKGQRPNLVMYSLELIGVVKLFCDPQVINHVPSLDMKKAANVVGTNDYFKNAKLKQLDIYHPNSEHARDATRHLMHWFMFRGGSRFDPDNTELQLVSEEWLYDAYR